MQETLDWIHSQTGRRVIRSKRLRGGLTSDVHAVTLTGGETLVLRLYTAWGKEAADCVEGEAATLRKLVSSELPAPRLVAAEPAGDVPMLLMTRMPGRVWLTPSDTDAWLTQMARTLVAVHATPVGDASADSATIDPMHIDIPAWTTRRELWEHVGSILAAPLKSFAPVFIHNDYQHFNMLWTRGRLTGLVDWVFARAGHPDADVAHCRLNLGCA
ncbi:MAG: phosphotransferase family protein, partial [Gemmatimonadaceae bacterium]